jgi:hypothetical protein
MAVSEVACPQVGCPAAVFYPFGHPTPYAYEYHQGINEFENQDGAYKLFRLRAHVEPYPLGTFRVRL